MPIHTFTYVARGAVIDEEGWADLVNAHVGAIPHKVVVDAGAELGADLDDLIRAQGEPFGSTSIYAQYRVFRAAREEGITVTLDGQGADELLAGYEGYPHSYFLSLLDRGHAVDAARFLKAWSQWPGRGGGGRAVRVALAALIPDFVRDAAHRLVGTDPAPHWLRSQWLRDRGVFPQALRSPLGAPDGHGRRLAEQLRLALTGRELVRLLRHGDRNSMRWSVESRVPFLTTDLAEFLLSLPEEYLLSSEGETKHVFRAAMRGIVPDVILDRSDKVGFETPERTWLRGLRPQLDAALSGAADIPFLNHQACHKEVGEMLEGTRPFSFQAWRLINYCRWAQLQAAS